MFKNISKNLHKLVNFQYFFLILGVFLIIPACVKNTDLVGYTFKSENIDQVKVQKTTKSQVNEILGSPSITSSYGEDSWYYISTEYQSVAFLKPKIKEQKILAITF